MICYSEVGLFSLYQRSGGREHLDVMRAKILEREEYVTAIYDPLKTHLGFTGMSTMTYSEFYTTFLSMHLPDNEDSRVSACLRAVDFTDKGIVAWNDVLIMAMWLRNMFPEEIGRWNVIELCNAMYREYLLPVAKTYRSLRETYKKSDSDWGLPWAVPQRNYWSKSFVAREREKARRRSAGYATLLRRLRQFSGLKARQESTIL